MESQLSDLQKLLAAENKVGYWQGNGEANYDWQIADAEKKRDALLKAYLSQYIPSNNERKR